MDSRPLATGKGSVDTQSTSPAAWTRWKAFHAAKLSGTSTLRGFVGSSEQKDRTLNPVHHVNISDRQSPVDA